MFEIIYRQRFYEEIGSRDRKPRIGSDFYFTRNSETRIALSEFLDLSLVIIRYSCRLVSRRKTRKNV